MDSRREGTNVKGKPLSSFLGNTLTLSLPRVLAVMNSSQKLRQQALTQVSEGSVTRCTYVCVSPEKGVEGTRVLIGSSCVKITP